PRRAADGLAREVRAARRARPLAARRARPTAGGAREVAAGGERGAAADRGRPGRRPPRPGRPWRAPASGRAPAPRPARPARVARRRARLPLHRQRNAHRANSAAELTDALRSGAEWLEADVWLEGVAPGLPGAGTRAIVGHAPLPASGGLRLEDWLAAVAPSG